jgi:hypothetical protein
LDQRTYNKPLTLEVAAVWIEGSKHQGQFENSVVLHGKDKSWKGIRSFHGYYDPLRTRFFSKGRVRVAQLHSQSWCDWGAG